MATFNARDAFPCSAHAMGVLALRTGRPDKPDEAPDQATFLDRSLAAIGAKLERMEGVIDNDYDRLTAAASSTEEAQKTWAGGLGEYTTGVPVDFDTS